MSNGLRYSHQSHINTYHSTLTRGCVQVLTAETSCELWHQRLVHPGKKVMEQKHHCSDGVPDFKPKRHQMFHCACCDKAKVRKKNRISTSTYKTTTCGQRFHMYFGFVRVDDSHEKININKKRKIGTSIHGFNSYLVRIDAHTRYTWIFLTSSKDQPIDIIQNFQSYHGLSKGEKRIRTDQGGEFSCSTGFRKTAAVHLIHFDYVS